MKERESERERMRERVKERERKRKRETERDKERQRQREQTTLLSQNVDKRTFTEWLFSSHECSDNLSKSTSPYFPPVTYHSLGRSAVNTL